MNLTTNDIFAAVQLGIVTPEEARKLLGLDKQLSRSEEHTSELQSH